MTHTPPDIEIALKPQIGVRGVAACFALSGFVVAVVNGLVTGGEASWVLSRGLVAMGACFFAGIAIGAAGRAAVRERLAQYAEERPAPSGAPTDRPVTDDVAVEPG